MLLHQFYFELLIVSFDRQQISCNLLNFYSRKLIFFFLRISIPLIYCTVSQLLFLFFHKECLQSHQVFFCCCILTEFFLWKIILHSLRLDITIINNLSIHFLSSSHIFSHCHHYAYLIHCTMCVFARWVWEKGDRRCRDLRKKRS